MLRRTTGARLAFPASTVVLLVALVAGADPRRTCPVGAEVAPVRVSFAPSQSYTLDGVTWMVGVQNGHVALAHLGEDGGLVITDLATLDGAVSGALSGSKLWLLAPPFGRDQDALRSASVDLSAPESPVVAPFRPVQTRVEAGSRSFIAVEDDVGLLALEQRHGMLASRFRLAAFDPRSLEVGRARDVGVVEPVYAWCAVHRCSLLAVAHADEGPERRLVVFSMDRRGAVHQTLLSDEHVMTAHAVRCGHAVMTTWSNASGAIRTRTLDLTGKPRTGSLEVAAHAARHTMFASQDRCVVAVAAGGHWTLESASPDAPSAGEVRTIDRLSSSLLAAPVADGWIYGATQVDLAGLGALAEVRVSKTEGGFIPSSGEPLASRVLVDGARKFLGHSLAVPVARPDRGSVLVTTARDVAYTVDQVEPTSLLFPIRQPCVEAR